MPPFACLQFLTYLFTSGGIINRKHETKLIFLMNVPLKWLPPEAFFNPKCTIYRLATGLRPDPLRELIALPKSLAGFKGHTSEGREGKEVWGSESREVEKEGRSGEGEGKMHHTFQKTSQNILL